MTCDAWVSRHPYLQPIAAARVLVEAAAAKVARSAVDVPDWERYADDFQCGVPLLQSERAGVDLDDPASVVHQMVDELMSMPLPGWLARQCEPLQADPSPAAGMSALSRWLFWAVVGRDLAPVVAAFARWRDEDHWLRNYCPTCGAAPAMAQLAGRGEGRMRFLSCGCCGTRWRYRRTGCSFCEPVDDHRLAVLAVDGEDGLRIDYCGRCQGYLKTYDGEGHESVLLADWTSLHLDVLARDRGLKRLAASLYEI
jgi:FdhE protein